MRKYGTHQKMKLLTVEARVTQIMTDFPETRNCDKALQERFMYEFHNVTTFFEYTQRKVVTDLESIRRTRQKVQAKGLLMPTDPKVYEERHGKKQKEFKDYALDKGQA